MSERPVLFSAPMVRAILDGRKTQTRRLATSPLRNAQVGERLWVRETLQKFHRDPPTIQYAATISAVAWHEFMPPDIYRALDGRALWPASWRGEKRPSIHMPRWASRIALEVTGVRAEPLQDISDEDSAAEGLWYCEEGDAAGFWFDGPDMKGAWGDGTVECYERLWRSLHGDASWEDNPEVVAITFRRAA